jgi:hypothetical protein
MSVTYQSVGAVSQGSASCAPACPVVVNAADLLVLPVVWGNSTDEPPATPSGWTAPANNTYIGGAGSWGPDTGNRNVTVFYRVADGTEDLSSVTVNNGGSGTDRVISGQIARLSKTAAAWFVTVVGNSDSSLDTSFAIVAPTDPGAVNGDMALVGAVWAPDTVGVVGGTADISWAGTGSGATQIQSIANSNGNDHRFLLFRRPLTGTSTGAPSFLATGGANVAGSGAIVLIHDGASTVDIDPDDTVHLHVADSPAITQTHVLDPDDTSHTQAADSPAITQTHSIDPDDAAHVHEADAPSLTQTHVIDVDDASHDHVADSPTIEVVADIDVDDAAHEHQADSPALTQVHEIGAQDADHSHAADSPTITQTHQLDVDDTAHEHVADSPTTSVPEPTPASRTSVARGSRTSTAAVSSRTSTASASSRTSTAAASSRTSTATEGGTDA